MQLSHLERPHKKSELCTAHQQKQKRSVKSINECLYRGPVILENLYGLLLKFKMNKIGLVSDIEKTFLQVALHETN